MSNKAPGSTVLRMVENAMNVLNIEVETGWAVEDIKALAKEEGYYLNPSTSRFLRSSAPAPVYVPIPEPEPVVADESPAAPELTVVDDTSNDEDARPVTHSDIAALIAIGLAHSDETVQEAAAEAQAWLDLLAQRLVDAEHRSAAMAKVEHYRQLLYDAELEAGLITEPEDPAPPAKVVRAWAATAGIDCPTRGAVPRRVIDAYLAAQAGAA